MYAVICSDHTGAEHVIEDAETGVAVWETAEGALASGPMLVALGEVAKYRAEELELIPETDSVRHPLTGRPAPWFRMREPEGARGW